jgi:hypothetical protein
LPREASIIVSTENSNREADVFEVVHTFDALSFSFLEAAMTCCGNYHHKKDRAQGNNDEKFDDRERGVNFARGGVDFTRFLAGTFGFVVGWAHMLFLGIDSAEGQKLRWVGMAEIESPHVDSYDYYEPCGWWA